MGAEAQRDWGRYGLGAAVAGWLFAFLPAVIPAALALWCLGIVGGISGRRSARSGYGLAAVIVAGLGLAYVALGIVTGLLFF